MVSSRGALKDVLCLLLGGISAALKEVGPRQDFAGGLGPVGLPKDALENEARVTSQRFVGGGEWSILMPDNRFRSEDWMPPLAGYFNPVRL